jgi:thiamine monophosphate kinase
MKLYQIGKIIYGEKIFILENGKRTEIDSNGFEHFK